MAASQRVARLLTLGANLCQRFECLPPVALLVIPEHADQCDNQRRALHHDRRRQAMPPHPAYRALPAVEWTSVDCFALPPARDIIGKRLGGWVALGRHLGEA